MLNKTCSKESLFKGSRAHSANAALDQTVNVNFNIGSVGTFRLSQSELAKLMSLVDFPSAVAAQSILFSRTRMADIKIDCTNQYEPSDQGGCRDD
ncbi:hypothetical protein GBA52_025399 [Prunus armeniaca]|nr:hypothetical protein GBA52_025399 [Prunus armeniaca]